MTKTATGALAPIPIRARPQANIVAVLEEYLELAKKGEIDGLAIVALYAPATNLGTRATWQYPTNGYYRLVGALEDMKLDLLMSTREFKPL